MTRWSIFNRTEEKAPVTGLRSGCIRGGMRTVKSKQVSHTFTAFIKYKDSFPHTYWIHHSPLRAAHRRGEVLEERGALAPQHRADELAQQGVALLVAHRDELLLHELLALGA